MVGNVVGNVVANDNMAGGNASDGGLWLTYSETAELLGVSLEAAKRRAARGRWPRRLQNADGRARVLVPPGVAHSGGGHVGGNTNSAGRSRPKPDAGGHVAPHDQTAVLGLVAALDAARESAARQDAELARLRDALRTAEAEAAVGRTQAAVVRRLEETVGVLQGELGRLHDAHRLALEARQRPALPVPSPGLWLERIKGLFAARKP